MTAELVTKTQLEAEIRPLNQTAGGKEAPVTRLEVRGYLFLNELQPGSIKRDTQTPSGVRQTPPFLGERHHKRERHRIRPAAQNRATYRALQDARVSSITATRSSVFSVKGQHKLAPQI